MKDGPAFHRHRFARVVRQHEHRHVIRRGLPPPPPPPGVGAKPAPRGGQVFAPDINTHAFPQALGKKIFGGRPPPPLSLPLPERARAPAPAVHLPTTPP